MNKFFTLLVNKLAAIIHSTIVVERVTPVYHITKSTSGNQQSTVNSQPPTVDSPLSKENNQKEQTSVNDELAKRNNPQPVIKNPQAKENNQRSRVNDDMAMCTETKENNTIQRFASFLFSPIADIFSNAASAKKECYNISLAKGFLNTKGIRLFIIALLTTVMSFGFVQSIYAQGPGATWTFYRPITLSAATPVANFQVKVTLTSGQYTNMKADGSDLRFYDNANTNCEYWIETWNNPGTSIIWVKVPTSGATALLMYYGYASATAVGNNGANVFDFFDDFTTFPGTWSTTISGANASVNQAGSIVTLSSGTTNSGSVYLSSAFTPTSTSFFLEAKHKEGAYNRNRFYAATALFGGNPLGFDNGYFFNGSGGQTTAQIFWNGSFQSSTTVNAGTDYLSQWQITDGAGPNNYTWSTYTYPAMGLVKSNTATFNSSSVRFISIGVTEAASTSTIVDWVRVRKSNGTDPTASVGSQTSNTAATTPATFSTPGTFVFVVPAGVTSVKVECWGGGAGGNNSNNRGGGGGAFAGNNAVAVTPGNIITVTVGDGGDANNLPNVGGNSSFGSFVIAAGANAENGGLVSASTGSAGLVFAGGNGGTSSGTAGAGGGGSGGAGGAGGVGGSTTNSTPGIAGLAGAAGSGSGGAAGGAGGTAAGNPGSVPGGGGGERGSSGSSGVGANGRVLITWSVCTSITATATKNDISCFNTNTGIITVNVPGTGTAPFQYSIDNGVHYFSASGSLGYIAGATFDATGTTTKSFNNLPTGVYKVRIKDANGCESKQVQ